MKGQKTNAAGREPSLILLGFDEAGKPRAARFAGAHSELATKAAGLMGLTVFPVTADVSELAKKLPAGRLYANGNGFVPTIRRNLFAKLIEAAGITEASLQQHAPSQPEMPEASPALNWDEIDVGKLVLAKVGPGDGWWEAVVIERADDMMTLRWRDFPKDPAITRERTALALLNPDA
jgi:hypothetical protein